ncbi:MAG TPA: 4,5-dihydroxyphthalate dehydrogenase [Verrucomicrobiales bacterium]|nr:4,5-dihydroxyphthalate dehydrogenase [Verrucomicrobiales bacterium]
MKQFNVGVIGHGWAATAHIPAINNTGLAKVTSILSARPLDDRELSAKYGHPVRSFTSQKEFLAQKDLDVVDITGYPWEHSRSALAAAAAGKHFILEKPIALTWKECRAIEAAARKARVKTCVCFEVRYSGQFLTIKSVIDNGLLGRVHYGEVDYYHGVGPWYGQYRWNVKKSGGGSSLLSAGCHALDALLLCMGGEVDTVTSLNTASSHEVFRPYEYPTTTTSLIKFKDGRVGKCASVIDCFQPYYFHVHLVGSEGSLLDGKIHTNKLASLNKKKWSELSIHPIDSGDVADHPYQTQFEAFFKSLADGREMPLTSLSEALKSHRVIFAADKSAAAGGRPVRLSQIPL